MICKIVRAQILRIDNGESPPFYIKWHLKNCPACNGLNLNLQETLANLQRGVAFKIPFNKTNDILNHIYGINPAQKHLSYPKWIFPGLMLIFSTILLHFSDYVNWLNQYFGRQLEAPLSLVMGIFLTIYVVIFMGAHSEELKKFWPISKKIAEKKFIN